MAKSSDNVQMLRWDVNGTVLTLKINGVEKFTVDCTTYPEAIRQYALADRIRAKLQDTCAKTKDQKLSPEEALATVQAMDKQLREVGWNSGTKGGAGETAKVGKEFLAKVRTRTYEQLQVWVGLEVIDQATMDAEVKRRDLKPEAPAKPAVVRNGRRR